MVVSKCKNIANVSLENFPYVLDLKVIYTLTLLKGGSKLPLIFFIFYELLYSLSRSEMQLLYIMLISNNRASFPLWWKKNLVKHLKKSRNVMKMILVSKYFSKHNHDLNNKKKPGKFIIIELLRNICPTTTETIKERLKQPQTWHFSATLDIKYPSLLVNHKFFI